MNWGSKLSDNGLSSVTSGERKHSLRNITPRSYSSLLKSDSEGEDSAEDSTVKPTAAAQSNQGIYGFMTGPPVCVSVFVTVALSEMVV